MASGPERRLQRVGNQLRAGCGRAAALAAAPSPATSTTTTTTTRDWCTPVRDSKGRASTASEDAAWFLGNFTKHEEMVPMRDGVELLTQFFVPKPGAESWTHDSGFPMLLQRTTYSCAPYGLDSYPDPRGPMKSYAREGFIFVMQDVRGRNGSGGAFRHMRPHVSTRATLSDIDESSDTCDTVEWLINHVPHSNGRVGILGISYPGFFSAAAMVDSHPALVCASPQAPITDMWIGDDFHHNGALYLTHAFHFIVNHGKEVNQADHREALLRRTSPRADVGYPGAPPGPYGVYDYRTSDDYEFFMRMGPLKNMAGLLTSNGPMIEHGGGSNLWPDIVAHPNYDGVYTYVDTPAGPCL